MTLGEQIKQRREALHMTQEDLAEKLGVSRQAVSKWEGDLAAPQGANRTTLIDILGLDIPTPEAEASKSQRGLLIAGWITAAILFIGLAAALLNWPKAAGIPPSDSSFAPGLSDLTDNGPPAVSRVRFYDEDQEEVSPVALWYDVSRIDSILLEFSGGTPDQVRMFYTPGGSETAEQTVLLLTKAVPDGDRFLLLPADALRRRDLFGHVYFEASFSQTSGSNQFAVTVVSSELYNMVFDPGLGETSFIQTLPAQSSTTG